MPVVSAHFSSLYSQLVGNDTVPIPEQRGGGVRSIECRECGVVSVVKLSRGTRTSVTILIGVGSRVRARRVLYTEKLFDELCCRRRRRRNGG